MKYKMDYEMILKEAHKAGQKALDKCVIPMFKWSAGSTHAIHGECGVAGVQTKEHGAGTFVKHLKAKYNTDGWNYIQKDCYRGGWKVPTDEMVLGKYDQEVAPKYAYCEAYAEVLRCHGLKAFAWEYLT